MISVVVIRQDLAVLVNNRLLGRGAAQAVLVANQRLLAEKKNKKTSA